MIATIRDNEIGILKIVSHDRTQVVLEEVRHSKEDAVPLSWYNAIFRCISTIRYLFLKTKKSPEQVLEYLQQHPEIRLVNYLSHTRFLNDPHRIGGTPLPAIQLDGALYIDEFGFYVFHTTRLGRGEDVDLRYESGQKDDQLFTLDSHQ